MADNQTTSYISGEGNIDKMALRTTLKYLHFGSRLMRVREKKGIRSGDLAEALGMSRRDYMRYECGELIPEKVAMISLAKILEIPLEKLLQWRAYAMHQAGKKFEDKPAEDGALKYAADWELAVEKLKKAYDERFTTKLDPKIVTALANMHKSVSRLYRLPIMPMPLFMILSTLAEYKGKDGYLYEIQDYVVDGESFAGYVARDPYFGPFITYAANTIFFYDAPSLNILDCFNRLTIEQFKTLLLVASHPCGIYNYSEDLVFLQQFNEFSSLAGLMTQRLKPYLPDTVNFDHLYTCVLAQSASVQAFCSMLSPSLLEENVDFKDESFSDLLLSINDMMHYHLHPVVSGMIAANWNCPDAVVRCLIDHHEPLLDEKYQPRRKEITPLNATLKLVNYFVDCDFPVMKIDAIEEMLQQYPQIPMRPESLFKVVNELNRLREHLVEISSNMIEKRSQQVSTITSRRIKTFRDNHRIHGLGSVMLVKQPKRSEFRFDPEYQHALINECYQMFVSFITEMLMKRRKESLDDYEKRMGNIQVAYQRISDNNLDSLADKFDLSADEVTKRLKQLF
ncbi:MAG: helix-turn-helix transcriptional regulator [Deltaproteobacteria bacterium]|nr:helix-turn-helix transcriptional regulator [Deltaproteobacteria bacterium]